MTLFITSPCFSERSLCHPWLLYQPLLTFLRKEDALYISIYAKGGENSPAVISYVLRMGRVLEKVLSISWMGNSSRDFLDGSDGKVSVCNAGDPGSIPGSGKSPGEGNGNPLKYYCLENPMDGGAS